MIKFTFKMFILYIILCSIGFYGLLSLLITSRIDINLFYIMTACMGLIFSIIVIVFSYLNQNINNLENEIERLQRKLDEKY